MMKRLLISTGANNGGQTIWHRPKRHESSGGKAQEGFDFLEAFREFTKAAQRAQDDAAVTHSTIEPSVDPPTTSQIDRVSSLWMRAARAAEMSELWRIESGTWEWLGNYLGEQILAQEEPGETGPEVHDRYRPPEERKKVARYYVISDGEWSKPRSGRKEKYTNQGDIWRHQQAWTYTWAAFRAQAHGEYADSARLFRRSGVCWEKSHHEDRHRRAANSYFDAAINAAKTSRFETRQGIHQGWCPSCLREKATEANCPSKRHHNAQSDESSNPRSDDTRPEERVASDIDRILRCWMAVRGGIDRNAEDGLGEWDKARQDECRQLTAIQRQLARNGDREQAVMVYRVQRKQNLAHLREKKSYIKRAGENVLWRISKNGSDVRRFSLLLAVAYLVIVPSLWWLSGAVATNEEVRPGPDLVESLIFSLSTTLTLSTGHFEPGSWVTNLIQSLQALSAFFALGYIIWMFQRSYDE
jgi:hypothetical protein